MPMGELIPLPLCHCKVEVQETKLDLMSGLLCEVTPDNFRERTFEVRPLRVKLRKIIASDSRNCFPELSKRFPCLQLLYLKCTAAAPCSLFVLAMRYTPSLSTRFSPCSLSHQRQVWKTDKMWGHTGHIILSMPLGQLDRKNCDSCIPLA